MISDRGGRPVSGCIGARRALQSQRWRDCRVPRRILVVALLTLLCACVGSRSARTPHGAAAAPGPAAAMAPKPAEGLWAILDPGCAKPSIADFRAWPHCASPFWINGHTALVIEAAGVRRGTVDGKSYLADYSFAPGDPLIAQVGTEKDGYLFLALTDLTRDASGRLVGAAGAAVACPKPIGGALALKPSDNGCDAARLDVVRQAAEATLQDRADLTKVAWIAPGAPEPR
jgi:hypothetical protein